MIKANQVVAIDYTLKNADGEVIDTSDGAEPLHYLHGHENIVPGLERALTGRQVGDAFSVVVPPADGYGEVDPDQMVKVKRTELPDDLEPEVGVRLAMETENGEVIPLTISQVDDATVTLDRNHQLAGQTLYFEITVRAVRDATDEELVHGHVHGPGGAHP